MDLGLDGRVALVTGSSGGIGAAIASLLAAEGCHVLVHGRDGPAAERVAAGIEAEGGSAAVLLGDLAVPDGVARVADAALAAGVDVLVANAGPFAEDDWSRPDPQQWRATWDANVGSLVDLLARLLPVLRERGWGRVITVGTRATTTPLASMASYSAAKAAVANLTVSLAADLAGTGVTANCVSPGVIATASLQRMFAERDGRPWSEAEPDVTADYAPNPVGRLGRPDDVAAAVAFLASPRADYVTGATLRVDGGITGTV